MGTQSSSVVGLEVEIGRKLTVEDDDGEHGTEKNGQSQIRDIQSIRSRLSISAESRVTTCRSSDGGDREIEKK